MHYEKVRDLSTLIYYIERTACSQVLPELKAVFKQECARMSGFNFEKMEDRSLRMFTWVYLSAFEDLDPTDLALTHVERMEQIAFDAQMSKYILSAI